MYTLKPLHFIAASSVLHLVLGCDAEHPDSDASLRSGDSGLDEEEEDLPDVECPLGSIDFDDHCVSRSNIDDYVDFGTTTFLALSPCDADTVPAGCMDVLVAVGANEDRKQYRLLDENAACVTSPNTCFGGWQSPFHVAYETEAYASSHSQFIRTAMRFQWDQVKRVGDKLKRVTQLGSTHEYTTLIDGLANSSHVDVDSAYRILDPAGTILAEFLESYSLIASSDGGNYDVEQRCEDVAEGIENIATGLGESSQIPCDELPDEITIEGEAQGDGPSVSVTWDIEACDHMGGAQQKIAHGVAKLWEQDCKANPEFWFPGMFDEDDAIPEIEPVSVSPWVDESDTSTCLGESYSATELLVTEEPEGYCEQWVDVYYECGEAADGTCECVEVDRIPRSEETCTS